MKVLSLNLHCFAEKNIVENQHTISNFILRNDIDIIFFQEVAQSEQDELVTEHIRKDNYALIVQQILEDSKKTYYLHYMFGNLAFGSYQEGLAILSKYKYKNKLKVSSNNSLLPVVSISSSFSRRPPGISQLWHSR